MTAALNLDGPANLELIHLDEPRELAYWVHVLGCSEAELEKIVGMVGPHAIDVRRHLARVRHAESQRKRRQAMAHVHDDVQAPQGGSTLGLVAGCCFAAMVAALGASAYEALVPDPWVTFQREYGCQAVANSDPTIKQLRCLAGRLVRTKLADTDSVSGAAAKKPMR